MANHDDSFFDLDQVASALGEPDVPIEGLVGVVERDEVLSRRLLRLANSAPYARFTRVKSVRDAIVRLGTARLAQEMFDAAA